MRAIAKSAVVVTAALGLLAKASNGQELPAPYLYNSVSVSGELPVISAGVGTSGISDPAASAEGSIFIVGNPAYTAYPDVAASALVSTTYPAFASAESEVKLNYYFAIEGPGSQGSSVPVDIEANLSAQALASPGVPGVDPGSIAVATAALTLSTPGSAMGLADILAESNNPDVPSGVYDHYFGALDLGIGTVYEVEMLTQAEATTESASAGAFVDPMITIDSNFLDEHPGYSIEFSPGITQGSGVPDGGSTVTLLGGALACLAAVRRQFTK